LSLSLIKIEGLVHDKQERADFIENIISEMNLFIIQQPSLNGYDTLIVDENHPYVAQFTNVVATFKMHYPGEIL
jgi:hypothetical protein